MHALGVKQQTSGDTEPLKAVEECQLITNMGLLPQNKAPVSEERTDQTRPDCLADGGGGSWRVRRAKETAPLPPR